MASLAHPQPRPHHRAGIAVASLVTVVAAGAALGLALAAPGLGSSLHQHLSWLLTFLAATVFLQLCAVRLPGQGTISVSAVGIVAAAIALGAGPAMAIAVVAALTQWVRARGLLHRALFDASNFALSAGVASLTYHGLADAQSSGALRLLGAVLAGLAYTTVNHGLLCAAIGVSARRSPYKVWAERFHWARYHFLAYGALALLAVTANDQLGSISLLALILPPLLLWRTMQNRIDRGNL